MTTRFGVFPEYRFFIPGKAESFRSPKASGYKRRVRREAKKVLKKPFDGPELNVALDYFHQIERRFDMDNVSKCVLDALNGVAYKNDRSVRWQTSASHFLSEPISIPDGPVDLVKPLKKHHMYLFVRIRVHARLWPQSSTDDSKRDARVSASQR
jgi:Holliday junction resolvase RusA-like endonuclease